MQINQNGLVIDTMETLIQSIENNLKTHFGEEFKIEEDSHLGALIYAQCELVLELQTALLNIAEQFDPQNATGYWQDALYERIGVKRMAPQKTKLTLKICGTANIQCPPKSILIRALTTNHEFTNIHNFNTNNNGEVTSDFECTVYGAIEVNKNEEFEIIVAPDGIENILASSEFVATIGRQQETDEEFRARYKVSKALNGKASNNANNANLTQYVDFPSYLKIADVKTDINLEPGTIKIIAKHNTTDDIFANAIFQTIGDGMELLGSTTIIVYDLLGTPITIKFEKPQEINIYI